MKRNLALLLLPAVASLAEGSAKARPTGLLITTDTIRSDR